MIVFIVINRIFVFLQKNTQKLFTPSNRIWTINIISMCFIFWFSCRYHISICAFPLFCIYLFFDYILCIWISIWANNNFLKTCLISSSYSYSPQPPKNKTKFKYKYHMKIVIQFPKWPTFRILFKNYRILVFTMILF